jgi:2-dehydro-3-deoxyphosphogluconate aldolase/(4S)-4-hydroxy-2-oxoglutarate aldolase
MTLTEMITALEAGADVIKVFQGSVFGPDYIKARKEPLPQAISMPAGGVSIDNAGRWIKNGCMAIGIGSELTSGAKNGDFKGTTETATHFVEVVREARK